MATTQLREVKLHQIDLLDETFRYRADINVARHRHRHRHEGN